MDDNSQDVITKQKRIPSLVNGTSNDHEHALLQRGTKLPVGDGRADSCQPIAMAEKFWNVNVPQDEQTEDCPDFLRYALDNEKDRGILGTPNALYRRQTWEDVKGFIRDNRLDLFMRVPSDLRLYREYCSKLITEYGSVMNFVMKERLGWKDFTCNGPPFSNPDDYKILRNDWPYGVDERTIHLVVWPKFELPADPSSAIGDLAPDTRDMIQTFVDKTFVSKCGAENVIWFKNWAALKSIHAVEHFHVMLFDPDMRFISHITNGDVPLQQKLRHGMKD